MSDGNRTITIPAEEAGVRLDRWFKRQFEGVTQGQVEKLLRTGQIRVDGGRAKSSTRLEAGQEVRVPPLSVSDRPKEDQPRKPSKADTQMMRDMVIFEDDDILALNKPAGLAVQGGTGTSRHVDGLLDVFADGKYRPKLVHRLDRDTSGVLLIAKHPKSAADLGDLFRERTLKKVYWAVVAGVPKPNAGQIRSWMVKGTGSAIERERMVPAEQSDKGSVHAVTDYSVISQAAQRAAWMALYPQTGRTHQLRFHMEEIGTPILGDTKYVGRREKPTGIGNGLHLHARALIIPRGTRKPLTLQAPIPKHFEETFDALGFDLSEAGTDPMEPLL